MNEEKICCPKFDPAPWDGKAFEWQNKKFIKDKVFTLFYMPMNFGGVMKRVYEKVEKAGITIQEGMWLSDHASKWNMDLYVAVDKEVAGAENVTLSGKFLSKVYEGNFKDTGKWTQDFENYAKGKGISVKKMYMWYTTCPKCAKKYGKNYVVLVGQIN
ncbi:hypothetical protein KKG19_06095 [Patescibacteria group bacterium]|nr:hypothetical protein [Patescibacteria group bacterium]